MIIHEVRKGDTLSRIARKFDVPLFSILAANGISDPNRISVGMKLKIPAPSTDEMDALPPPPAHEPAVETGIPINRARFALPPNEYIPEITKKDLIVLHFTAGRSAESAFNTWKNDPARIATAYLVDTDGAVYEVFDPAFWAFHLGLQGTKGKHDKRSIGIEIANVGPLERAANSDVLNWWPNNWGTRFCTLADTGKYVESTYREKQYFAAFPDQQAEVVGKLIGHLCERFRIPRVVCDTSRRTECDPDFFASHKGIATHANFRKDKWDIGPAYNWDRLGI